MGDEKEKKHTSDANEIKEILEVVSEKIPALLNSLTDVLYGAQQAEKYGKAVAGFYKSLKDAGMTEEQAYELTKQYMSSLNFPAMIGEAISGKAGKKHLVVDAGAKHIEVDSGNDEDESS